MATPVFSDKGSVVAQVERAAVAFHGAAVLLDPVAFNPVFHVIINIVYGNHLSSPKIPATPAMASSAFWSGLVGTAVA